MTIETGVVKGNFDRVEHEIEELLHSARLRAPDDQVILDLEERFNKNKLKASAFLNSLPADSLEEAVVSTKIDTQPKESPETSSASADAAIAEAAETTSAEEVESDDLVADKVVEDESDSSDNDSESIKNTQLDAIQVQLSEILIAISKLEQLVTNQVKEISQLAVKIDEAKKVAVQTQVEPEALATAIVVNNHDSTKWFVSELGKNPKLITPDFVAALMKHTGDVVMNRSDDLLELWQLATTVAADNFNGSQLEVITRLLEYQKNLQRNPDMSTVGSPWGRGMEKLF